MVPNWKNYGRLQRQNKYVNTWFVGYAVFDKINYVTRFFFPLQPYKSSSYRILQYDIIIIIKIIIF